MLAPADLTQIDDGLWRWTVRHPAWRAGARPGSAADWPAEVGSVAYVTGRDLVVIDPLVPPGADALWEWLDERAAEADRVHALTTIKFHRRSRDELAGRYAANTSRAKRALPRGVITFPIRGAGETMFWLEGPRALVPGDRIVGDGAGGLRLCHASWLTYLSSGIDLDGLRAALRPLLKLPIERVLASHGRPVLRDGRSALAQALA